MSISALLDEFRTMFERHGAFTLMPGQAISAAVREHKVPNEFGAYVISIVTGSNSEVVYVGKAGTVAADGQRKKQGLRQRLTKRQGKENRGAFFRRLIEEESLVGLRFEWFVTLSGESPTVLPLLAEARLLQAFFDEHRRLPKLNASA